MLPDARAPGELTLRGQEPNLRSVQAAILDTFGHLPFNPLTILTHFNRLRRRSSIYLSSTGCCTTATSSTIWVLSSSMSSRTAENARRPAPRRRASRATAIALNCRGTGARQDPALHGHALRHRPFRVSRETAKVFGALDASCSDSEFRARIRRADHAYGLRAVEKTSATAHGAAPEAKA